MPLPSANPAKQHASKPGHCRAQYLLMNIEQVDTVFEHCVACLSLQPWGFVFMEANSLLRGHKRRTGSLPLLLFFFSFAFGAGCAALPLLAGAGMLPPLLMLFCCFRRRARASTHSSVVAPGAGAWEILHLFSDLCCTSSLIIYMQLRHGAV